MACTARTPKAALGGDDLAALPYSSGTTGLSKGVMLTHRNLVAGVLQTQPLNLLGPDSRMPAVLPLFHIYGITGLMNGTLYSRGRIVTMPRFDLPRFLAAIEEHRIDHLYIAPPMALALLNCPQLDEYDLSSVKPIMSAAAPLDRDLARALAKRLDAVVVEGYGLTESSPTTHMTTQPTYSAARRLRICARSTQQCRDWSPQLTGKSCPFRRMRGSCPSRSSSPSISPRSLLPDHVA
ncbi:AMP-binding protein [Streptomyces mirabilis]|uniref:AMP-binding protein n=1 Tax=Streptomyces mirabilis TaxID=68239 RepID=UPI0036620133